MPVILCPKCQHKYIIEAPIYIASVIVFCPICLHIYSFEECGCAAEQGHPHAQYYVGYCYYHGLGVNVCRTLALSWFQKAAEQGLVDALYMAGVCYDRGEGVDEDAHKAVEWYRKSAKLGSADAQYSLGRCYEYGRGVRTDSRTAMKWYRMAVDHGHTCAQDSLTKLENRFRSRQKKTNDIIDDGSEQKRFNFDIPSDSRNKQLIQHP